MKTADKYLQFGQDKCKAMVVGKLIESYHVPKLMVDTWQTSHGEDGELREKFGGNLGMEIFHDGRNMNTIIQRRNKQSGKKQMINNLLRPLGQFTFECGFIFLNSLIRNSVLYGAEAM